MITQVAKEFLGYKKNIFLLQFQFEQNNNCNYNNN